MYVLEMCLLFSFIDLTSTNGVAVQLRGESSTGFEPQVQFWQVFYSESGSSASTAPNAQVKDAIRMRFSFCWSQVYDIRMLEKDSKTDQKQEFQFVNKLEHKRVQAFTCGDRGQSVRAFVGVERDRFHVAGSSEQATRQIPKAGQIQKTGRGLYFIYIADKEAQSNTHSAVQG